MGDRGGLGDDVWDSGGRWSERTEDRGQVQARKSLCVVSRYYDQMSVSTSWATVAAGRQTQHRVGQLRRKSRNDEDDEDDNDNDGSDA